MKVLWTDAAIAQLQAIYTYLAETSPEYALRLVDRLTKRSIQIATFLFQAGCCRSFELNQIRELHEGSDRIIYFIKEGDSQFEVLAVIHAAREGPATHNSALSTLPAGLGKSVKLLLHLSD